MSTTKRLKMERPLVFIDLETTGVNTSTDRIVEITVLKIHSDGAREEKSERVNPGIPIPPSATKVHGITNEDVADKPGFVQYAKGIHAFFDGCDVGGYNAIRFDIPLLTAEFNRVGLEFDLAGRNVVDPMVIFHQHEPRDLAAAYEKYCGKSLVDAHSATADVRAAAEIFEAQVLFYPDLPEKMAELHEVCHPREPDWIDDEGKLIQSDQGPLIGFTLSGLGFAAGPVVTGLIAQLTGSLQTGLVVLCLLTSVGVVAAVMYPVHQMGLEPDLAQAPESGLGP